MNDVLKILLIGAAAYVAWILYEQYAAAATVPVSSGPVGGATGTTTTTSATATPATALSISNINSFPYSNSMTNLSSYSPQLNQLIASGQVPTILCSSVAAFMLGWGCSKTWTKGTTKTTNGQTYVFDGSFTWNLQQSGVSGLGYSRNYRFIGRAA